MSDIKISVPFVPGQRNVSHSDLNNAINDAEIQKEFITTKSAISVADGTNDMLMIYDQSDGQLKKISPSNLIFNAPDLITGREEKFPPDFADFVAIYDVSGAATKKTTLDNILGLLWFRSVYSTPIGADSIPIFDSSNGLSKLIHLSTLISGAVAHTAPLGADSIPIYDSAGGLYKRLTLSALAGNLPAHTAPITPDKLIIYDNNTALAKQITLGVMITGQVAETAPADADSLVFYDASAAATRKAVLSDLKAYFSPLSSTKQLAKAWVNFDGRGSAGSCTLRSNYNVTTVTRGANAGDYTITFASNMASTLYAVVGGGRPVDVTTSSVVVGVHSGTAPSVSACRIFVVSPGVGGLDPTSVYVAFFDV